MVQKTSLKSIPSVGKLLKEIESQISLHRRYIKFLIDRELSLLRNNISQNKITEIPSDISSKIVKRVLLNSKPQLVKVLNGTGIVLHTGFGRAPFNSKTLIEIANNLEGYVNLEFDLKTGLRGDRQKHVNNYISSICESESSVVVGNNAAAVMLSVNEIARSGEVIVSRGELVEIGGSFRIPDIIKKSGAVLKEVGTTNRTHVKDYENAISSKTKMILWVHTSNYVIKGFTHSVSLGDLVKIGQKHNIPVMADWGSGFLLNMKGINLKHETPITVIMKNKPDILTFSGDKLIGGPQSGIILGSKKLIGALKQNTLYRAFRCDKITIALLENTLRTYSQDYFTDNNLSLKLLTSTRETLLSRAEEVLNYITKNRIEEFDIKIIETKVEAGSGSLPENKIDSIALSFRPKSFSVTKLSKKLRNGETPVIGYINENTFYIDLKAILPSQLKQLAISINSI